MSLRLKHILGYTNFRPVRWGRDPIHVRIKAHQEACHDGKFDRSCPACREMKKKFLESI